MFWIKLFWMFKLCSFLYAFVVPYSSPWMPSRIDLVYLCRVRNALTLVHHYMCCSCLHPPPSLINIANCEQVPEENVNLKSLQRVLDSWTNIYMSESVSSLTKQESDILLGDNTDRLDNKTNRKHKNQTHEAIEAIYKYIYICIYIYIIIYNVINMINIRIV